MVVRSALRRVRSSGHNLQRILVVGAGLLGREITTKILAHREMGFEVVGFLDDDAGKQGSMICGVPVLGTTRQAEEVLAAQRIDQVFLTLPLEAHKKILQLLDLMARECVEIKLVPDILQYATIKAALEDVDGTPVINLSQMPLQGWNSMMKRGMDLAIALAALIVLLPILPLIALAIWIEDRGPVFYRQERMGLDGRSFMIVKFRSMRVNAEATSGPVWAIKDDPRRTRVGSLLRQCSFDELAITGRHRVLVSLTGHCVLYSLRGPALLTCGQCASAQSAPSRTSTRNGTLSDHTPSIACRTSSRTASSSSTGASMTSSSCTCSSICAAEPARCKRRRSSSMASLMRSAADPWMGVLVAARSANWRTPGSRARSSGR